MPQPNWHDILYMGFLIQSSGHPSITGMICQYMGFLAKVVKTPSLPGMICLHMGFCGARK